MADANHNMKFDNTISRCTSPNKIFNQKCKAKLSQYAYLQTTRNGEESQNNLLPESLRKSKEESKRICCFLINEGT